MQLTPPGSGCSICIGEGITEAAPGSIEGMRVVVQSAEDAYRQLVAAGVEATPRQGLGLGSVTFADPDGNRWAVQELPKDN